MDDNKDGLRSNEDEQNEKPEEKYHGKPQLKLPILAISCDGIAVLSFGLTVAFLWSGLFLIFALITVAAPVVGVCLGIVALVCDRDRIGKPGKALSIIAIAIPVTVVAVLVILFSSGAVVISWM